ncbi:MAG: caspase family protein [Flavobacteriaceae bacterium]|nr:caspase family protein [Flavobacteriaceae bacterium]
MTKRILTFAVLFLISSALYSQVLKAPFFDGFENNNNKWNTDKNSKIDINVKNGSYNFKHKRKTSGWEVNKTFDLNTNRDFKIEALIVKKSGVDNMGYGLMWGRKDGDNYFSFNITSGGYYRISRSKNGNFKNLVKWTKSSAVKTGDGKYNILKIEKKGKKINYYINDKKVETLNFESFYGDKIGFLVYGKQAVEINYLSVYYLNKSKPKPKSLIVSTKVGKLSFFDGFENNNNLWPVSNKSSGVIKVSGGSYNLNYKKDKGSLEAFKPLEINENKDFKIEALIVKKSGIGDYGYGLIWGRKDSDNYLSFNITGNGNYRISKKEKGTYKNLVTWTSSSEIKTGDGVYNILKIEKIGNRTYYYINDKLVETLDYKPLFGNQVGFVVYHAQAIEVNYLSVYYLKKNKPKPKPKVIVNNNNDYQNDVIFNDKFNSNLNDWAVADNENATLSVKNGYYNFKHKRDKLGWTSSKTIKINESKDFEIEADIKKVAGIQNNGFGIIWGRKDSDNEFQFFISGDGSYYIKYYEDNELNVIKKWTVSSYINTGNGATNKLKIRKIGNQYKYYINDNFVTQGDAVSFFGDRIGFIIYGNQSIAVNTLNVSYINKKIKSSDYLFYDEFSTNANNWAESKTKDYDFNFSGGKYYLEHKRKSGGWSTSIEKYFDENRDYEIEAKILKISGIQNNGFGIIWGRKGSGNTLEFDIASNGLYSVDRSDNSKRDNLIDWTSSSYVKKGNYAYNTLKIRKQNGVVKFYINGSYVNQVNNMKFLGNRIGFIIYDNQKIAIDYLKIKYIDKTVEPDVVITRKKEAWSDTFSNNNNDWATGNKDEYNLSFSGGYYNFEHKRTSGGWSTTLVNEIDQTRSFEISTEIKKISGAQNYGYGFVWGRKDSKNQFNFTLSGGGSFKIKKVERDNTTLLQDWKSSPYINKGNNVTNTLSIRKINSTLNFYINNNFVASKEFTPFLGNRLGFIVFSNQKIAINNLTVKYIKDNITNSPPTIVITEPAVTRGFKIVKAKRITVRGKATDSDGIYEVTINGVDAALQADGSFVAQVPLRVGDNNLNVKATDLKYTSTLTKFIIKREVKPIVIIDPVVDNNNTKKKKIVTDGGNYYALLIGISDYDDSSIVSLDGMPTDDIQNLADALIGYYTFKDENVEILSNPTRSKIIRAFDRLKKKISPKDNLLIFYAGHGIFDKDDNLGYWLPADAEKAYTDNWINNAVIRDNIKRIKSKHTLLISDACFSGSIFKTRSISLNTATKSIQKKYALPSRKAITSGTLKTVPNISVFMKYLLDRLETNTDAYLAARRLFGRIEEPVGNNSPNTPQYGTIQGVGDEGGDFIFIRKN